MKVLITIRRVLAVIAAVWALAVTINFLFFARIKYESTSVTSTNGQPQVTTTSSGEYTWISSAGLVGLAIMFSFTLLLAAPAAAEWRGSLAVAAPVSILALTATFIVRYSIGGMYLPGAVVVFLGAVLLAVEKWIRKRYPPTT